MLEANIINDSSIEINDVEMFALIGQKDIEIYMKDKTIERLSKQFDKMRNVLIELETIKKNNSELELINKELNNTINELNNNVSKLSIDSGEYDQLLSSNKSLSDMNIKLDQLLTEERQKVKEYSSRVAELERLLQSNVDKISQLNNELELVQKDDIVINSELGELKNVKYNKSKKGSNRKSTNT